MEISKFMFATNTKWQWKFPMSLFHKHELWSCKFPTLFQRQQCSSSKPRKALSVNLSLAVQPQKLTCSNSAQVTITLSEPITESLPYPRAVPSMHSNFAKAKRDVRWRSLQLDKVDQYLQQATESPYRQLHQRLNCFKYTIYHLLLEQSFLILFAC